MDKKLRIKKKQFAAVKIFFSGRCDSALRVRLFPGRTTPRDDEIVYFFITFAKKYCRMRKKILLRSLLAVLVHGGRRGLVARQQFYGNAVVAERDLYVSSRADYAQVVDSLLPQIKHHRAFDAYARRINLAETFKPAVMSSNAA